MPEYLVGCPGAGKHHLLPTPRAMWSPEGQQAQVELADIIEGIPRRPIVAGRFNRRFFTHYAGLGLVIVCCGRLRTTPPP